MEEENNNVEALLELLRDKYKNQIDEETLEVIIDEMIFSLLF